MKNPQSTRKIALIAGGLAVASMGLAVGCSTKEAPAPTAPVESHVDSKRPQTNPTPKQTRSPNSFGPAVKAPPAPTAEPGNNN